MKSNTRKKDAALEILRNAGYGGGKKKKKKKK